MAAMDYDKCLDRAGEFSVKIWSCHGGGGNQHWAYDEKTRHLTDLGGWLFLSLGCSSLSSLLATTSLTRGSFIPASAHLTCTKATNAWRRSANRPH